MRLAIIAAIARNRVIGKEGKLPWHISEDLRRFKNITIGHAVLMGRKTYESIGRPLPDRRNAVLSSSALSGVETFATIADALRALSGEDVVFVIGGASVFAALLERADELYLTLIHRDVEGDTFFPPYEHLLEKSFRKVASEERDGYSFETYSRK